MGSYYFPDCGSSYHDGCRCQRCRARHNGQQKAYRARLRDQLRAAKRDHDRLRSASHGERVRVDMRQERENAQTRWRCDCGRLAQGFQCACGAKPVWAAA